MSVNNPVIQGPTCIVSNCSPAIDSSAVLEVSGSGGILPPRMSTTERNAITSPAKGLLVYDNTANALYSYNGSSWVQVGIPAASPVVAQAYLTSSSSTLTLSDNVDLAVDFDTVVIDTANAISTGSGWKFTAPVTGNYNISVFLQLNSGSYTAPNSQLAAFTNLNGATDRKNQIAAYQVPSVVSTAIISAAGSKIIPMVAGDYLQITCFQLSGNTQHFYNNTPGFNFCNVSISLIH